jgi:hypothetical protein
MVEVMQAPTELDFIIAKSEQCRPSFVSVLANVQLCNFFEFKI